MSPRPATRSGRLCWRVACSISPCCLYRRGSGEIVAMEDRCVHRAYPLSAGRLEGDRLVCGYHGFTYDPDGCCVEVPSQETSRPGRVRAHLSRAGGVAVRLDLARRAGSRPACARRRGLRGSRIRSGRARAPRCYVEANYLLLHEDYLDLTTCSSCIRMQSRRASRSCRPWTRWRSPRCPSPTPATSACAAGGLGGRGDRPAPRDRVPSP